MQLYTIIYKYLQLYTSICIYIYIYNYIQLFTIMYTIIYNYIQLYTIIYMYNYIQLYIYKNSMRIAMVIPWYSHGRPVVDRPDRHRPLESSQET